jgi:TolB-like protein
MVAAQQPFQGATVPEMFSAILRDAPTPLPSSVPAELKDVISRCLERQAAHRFATAREVRDALERIHLRRPWFGTSVSPRRASAAGAVIAVVVVTAVMSTSNSANRYTRAWFAAVTGVVTSRPATPRASTTAPIAVNRRAVGVIGFRNVSGRADVAYISTALDEGMASDLSAGDRLRIVSTEEVARLKRDLHLVEGNTFAPDTLRLVKAGLGVDLIVTGSYTAVGVGMADKFGSISGCRIQARSSDRCIVRDSTRSGAPRADR